MARLYWIPLFVVLLGALLSSARCAEPSQGLDIMGAAAAGDIDRISYLLTSKTAAVTDTGELGWTPLHHAAYHGRDAACLSLLAFGADPKAKAQAKVDLHGFDAKDSTPDAFATMTKHHGTAGLLSKYIAYPEDKRRAMLSRYLPGLATAPTTTEDEPPSPAQDPFAAERERRDALRSRAKTILSADAAAIARACEKIHQNPKGDSGAKVLASVRSRIPTACDSLLPEWKREDRSSLYDLLGKSIGASGLVVSNRIDEGTAMECLRKVASVHEDAAKVIDDGIVLAISDKAIAQKKRQEEEARAAQPVLIENARWVNDGYVRYIRADITNNTKTTIRHLTLSVKLFDSKGRRAGQTHDTIASWEPGEVWAFNAPVFENSASRMEWGDVAGF